MRIQVSDLTRPSLTQPAPPKATSSEFNAELEEAKRPNIAQFMAATGASSKDAIDILSRYKDWALYMPESGWPDTSEAQRQLAEERASGVRSGDTRSTEKTDVFEWKFAEPDAPGAVLPVFKDYGNEFKMPSITFLSGSEERPQAVTYRDKEQFYRDAMGYGVGTSGLDAFARKLGAADFLSLDWESTVGSSAAQGSRSRDGDMYSGPAKETWTGDYVVIGDGPPRMVSSGGTTEGLLKDIEGSGYYTATDM